MKSFFYTCFMSFALLLMIGCESDSTAPQPTNCELGEDLIEITSPKAGDTYKVGTEIAIAWKADASKLSGVYPVLSNDNGETWGNPLSEGSLNVGSSEKGCFEYKWTVTKEALKEGKTNDQVRIRVRDYNDGTVRATSDSFTVTP